MEIGWESKKEWKKEKKVEYVTKDDMMIDWDKGRDRVEGRIC